MSYQLFEVWQQNQDGDEELLETTASTTQAMKIARQALQDRTGTVVIYEENSDGELNQYARLTMDASGAIINT